MISVSKVSTFDQQITILQQFFEFLNNAQFNFFSASYKKNNVVGNTVCMKKMSELRGI